MKGERAAPFVEWHQFPSLTVVSKYVYSIKKWIGNYIQ